MSRGLSGLVALPSEPVALSVLTGFLGSGKTTFLSRVLEAPDLSDTAVVIGEFGAVALDHLLLEATTDEVVELPNGCTCCAVRQDLAEAFHRLLRARAAGDKPAFRRIALETSGLADPAPILYTLSADAFLEAAVRLDRVVATVDSVAGRDTLARFAESTAQAAVADLLVLTKTDIASPPAELTSHLEAINPLATIVDGRAIDAAAALFGGTAASLPRPRPFSPAAHTHGVSSIALRLRRPMTRLQFALALGGLAREHGDSLLRVKGLVAFADRDGGPAAIHAVQHTLYPPRWLPAWPDSDDTSRLVFIVRDLPSDEIVQRFQAGDPMVLGSPQGVS